MAQQDAAQTKTFKTLMRLGLVLIYVIVTGTAAVVTFFRVREMAAASELLPDFTASEKQPPSENVVFPEGQSLPKWTGTERITVLLLGIDERAQWNEPAWRTDTMMVLTLDPVTLEAGVLSIPRDLWVEIPTSGYGRINTAHYLGDLYDYPGGGPALAALTVERNLGIHIDYYVRINFEAFVTFVDEIGGIDIEVPETIDDPLYPDNNYGYDPLYIEAGRHHFYGDMALKYARTRHSGNGDFDRARRQQQVIQAVLDRVSRPEVLAQLLAKAPELYAKVESSLATSLKFDQLLALAGLAREVDPDNIRFAVIDESSTLPWETPEGWQVLVPIHDRIRERRDFVFWIGPAVEDNGAAEEGATLLVLNGTQREGLAYATAEYLKENRVPVATYSNADRQDYESSLVIMNRSLPQTAQRLLALLQLPDSALVQGDNPTAEYDIVIILGRDYAEP